MNPAGMQHLRDWTLRAGKLWLFLDYDGTLADFAPTPDIMRPDAQVIEVLTSLVHRHQQDYRVAVLSGRRLDALQQLLPVAGIFLGGVYGLEIQTPRGEHTQRGSHAELRPTLDAIKRQWERIMRGRAGFFLEDKGFALALHARWAEEPEADHVLDQARSCLAAQQAHAVMRVLEGHRFLEVAPSTADKGLAVSYLLQKHPLQGSRPLYIGDDERDEEAFAVIHAHGGVAVRVLQPSQVSRQSRADFLLDSPAETIALLRSLN